MTPDILDDGNTPVCFLPGGKRIIVCLRRTDKDGKRTSYQFRGYDIATGTPAGPVVDFAPPPEPGWSVYTWRITDDGAWLVVEYLKESSGVWHAWNLATGKELSLTEPFNRVAFSADGRFVLGGWSGDGVRPSLAPTVVHDLRAGQPVGPGLVLPRSFFFVGLSRGGQAALVAEDHGPVRVYSVSDGRCTLARPIKQASNSLTFSPAGNRVALWDQVQGEAGIVEVRDVATGRLVAAPLPTPRESYHLDFSADGRLLAVATDDWVRLLDVETGLPLGPWLPFATTGPMGGDLPNNDFRLAVDNTTLLTRLDWRNSFRIWDLKPDLRPIEQLATLAELHAGRRLTDAGAIVPLSLDEYQAHWQKARAQHPQWFAPQAPERPEKVPTPPPAPTTLANGQPLPRPEQTPDYAAVIQRFAGADQPPLVSVAAALRDKNDGVRRAALEAALTMKLDRPVLLALLIEGLKDVGVRDRAIERIGSLGPEAAPAVPAMLEELRLGRKHSMFGSRGLVRSLGQIGPGAAEAVPALREMIASLPQRGYNDEWVVVARALGRIGPAAEEALPELVGVLLQFPDPSRRSLIGGFNDNAVAIRALERVVVGNPDKLVSHLTTALKLKPMLPESGITNGIQFDARIGVVELIGRLGPRAKDTAGALRAVLAEPAGKNPQDLLRPAAA